MGWAVHNITLLFLYTQSHTISCASTIHKTCHTDNISVNPVAVCWRWCILSTSRSIPILSVSFPVALSHPSRFSLHCHLEYVWSTTFRCSSLSLLSISRPGTWTAQAFGRREPSYICRMISHSWFKSCPVNDRFPIQSHNFTSTMDAKSMTKHRRSRKSRRRGRADMRYFCISSAIGRIRIHIAIYVASNCLIEQLLQHSGTNYLVRRTARIQRVHVLTVDPSQYIATRNTSNQSRHRGPPIHSTANRLQYSPSISTTTNI